MKSMKVALFGASGLVGSRLFERWNASGDVEVVPIVNSTGNAWRIARTGRAVELCNLLDRDSVRAALQGCDAVVNATRGGDAVMIDGLRNLLDEAAAARVRRFVHLSSVLVYGDPPPATSVREESPANPVAGTYGATKAAQDTMVAKAAENGLSCAVLCPPNIGGPGSYFLLGVARAIVDGSLALLDGEPSPCNLADVDNLCDAIERALAVETVLPRRMFVLDRDIFTWPHLVSRIAERLGVDAPNRTVSRETIGREWSRRNVAPARPSMGRALRFIGSSRVRELLREDPMLGRMEDTAKRLIRKLKPDAEQRLLTATDGAAPVVSYDELDGLAKPFLYQQLRMVRHSGETAREALGYDARLTSGESVDAFCAWFLRMSGWSDAGFGDMARVASDIPLAGSFALRPANAAMVGN